ncbi:hypothetical protein [Mesorhizobium sp.]|uniref:COG3904 family protein n=1 Tax=Mesorhizobium sp. TaxID=1871066 RepID=UPI000FE8CB5E|nr:hypothetical protein [Mesorhizobium sp.]RWP58005.1 MAG: hypothetical protein EOR08_28805 [Mesorhizobium sp.]
MKNALPVLLAALVALIAPRAEAIEISMERGNATSKILVTGPIERGDAERFKAYWAENAYDSWNFIVSLDSPGGNLLEGLEIGRFLRKVEADTEVQRYTPATPDRYAEGLPGAECYSACALAFMGGVERDIPEGGTIGFHQFYGSGGSSADQAMELTQHISALIAGYLRDMGAKPELFELLSGTSPDKMFIPTRDEIAALGIVPQSGFHDFRLMPKDGLIVATAVDERNPGPLEKVYEIETLCWNQLPTINLYAANSKRGLSEEQTIWVAEGGGFNIETEFGTFDYGSENTKLYSSTRLLASLVLDPKVARSVGSGNAWVRVNGGSTASGVFMTGQITAPPGGDPAILASFRDCL